MFYFYDYFSLDLFILCFILICYLTYPLMQLNLFTNLQSPSYAEATFKTQECEDF